MRSPSQTRTTYKTKGIEGYTGDNQNKTKSYLSRRAGGWYKRFGRRGHCDVVEYGIRGGRSWPTSLSWLEGSSCRDEMGESSMARRDYIPSAYETIGWFWAWWRRVTFCRSVALLQDRHQHQVSRSSEVSMWSGRASFWRGKSCKVFPLTNERNSPSGYSSSFVAHRNPIWKRRGNNSMKVRSIRCFRIMKKIREQDR